MGTRPRMFIGSSAEGLKVARAVAEQLRHELEITTWSSGHFGLGGGTLETLLDKAHEFDFATLVLTPDDMVTSRDIEAESPRDNVIFEAGLFMGVLGRRRTFIVFDSDKPIKLPSDLAGISVATFKGNRSDNNVVAAVDEACHPIRAAVEEQGPNSRGVLARAVAGTRSRSDPARIRKTVWVIGSKTELSDEAVAFLNVFIPELCSRLVDLRCRVVVGDSPLLRQVAVAFRASMATTTDFIPDVLPVFHTSAG
jgi:hypothetical protein